MKTAVFARLAGTLALTLGLGACVDVNMDLEVLSQDTARGTMAVSMDASMYAMFAAQGSQSEFCAEGTITQTETKVTCTDVREGSFDELVFDAESDQPQPTITAIGGGQVRVSFPTASLRTEMGSGMGDDPQAKAMMAAMFEGHSMVLTVSGGRIVDTNMQLAPDGNSATLTLSFIELINGTADIADETYAVVQK
jgi:hypothetical protein